MTKHKSKYKQKCNKAAVWLTHLKNHPDLFVYILMSLFYLNYIFSLLFDSRYIYSKWLILSCIYSWLLLTATIKHKSITICIYLVIYSSYFIYLGYCTMLWDNLHSYSGNYNSACMGIALGGIFLAIIVFIRLLQNRQADKFQINWKNFLIKTGIGIIYTIMALILVTILTQHLFPIHKIILYNIIIIILSFAPYLAYSGFFPFGRRFKIKNIN